MFSNGSGSVTAIDPMRREATRKSSMTIPDYRSSSQKPRWPMSTAHLRMSFSDNDSTTVLGLNYASPMCFTKDGLRNWVYLRPLLRHHRRLLPLPQVSWQPTRHHPDCLLIGSHYPHRTMNTDVESDTQDLCDREVHYLSQVLRRVSAFVIN